MAGIETVIDRIARYLGKDSLEVRKQNFYGTDQSNITPYGQEVENNRLSKLLQQLEKSADYYNRRDAINHYNQQHQFKKKGLAFTPVKFGISFTTSFLNQAGALVHIYRDGTILANHGGTGWVRAYILKSSKL